MSATKNPNVVYIEPSARCNLRCVRCPTLLLEEKNKGLMTDEVFNRILLSLDDVSLIHIVGSGEPFLDKKILKRIKQIKEKYCQVTLTTHGGLLKDAKIQEVLECGLDCIRFSVDGATKETYESIRVKSNYEEVISNIRQLIHARDKIKSPLKVCFSYVVMKQNLHEVPQFVDLASKMKMDQVVFIGLFPVFSFNNGNDICDYQELIRTIMDAKKRLPGKIFTINIEKNGEIIRCPLTPDDALFVTFDGSVYPCYHLIYPELFSAEKEKAIIRGKSMGNILFETLENIWGKHDFIRFRDTWGHETIPEECRHCDFSKANNEMYIPVANGHNPD